MNKEFVRKVCVLSLVSTMTTSTLMQSAVNVQALTQNYSVNNVLNNDLRTVTTNDYDGLRNQWFQELIGVTAEDLNNTFVKDNIKDADNEAKELIEKMQGIDNPDKCLWIDLDSDTVKYGAKMTAQFERILKLAKVYQTPGSIFYQDGSLKNKIIEATAFVNDNFYSTPKSVINGQGSSKNNWWDWEIGTPTHVTNLLVVMYDVYTPELRNQLIENVDVYTPNVNRRTLFWNIEETAANLADKALIVTLRAIVDDNDDKLAHVSEHLPVVFKYVTSGDGFYKDGSFVQHTNVAYTGAYGYVLLDAVVNILSILQNTKQALSSDEYSNLYAFIQDSFIPALSLGGNNMDMVRGRSASRESWQSNRTGRQIISALVQLAQVAPKAQKDYINGVCKTLIKEGSAGQSDYYKYITNADIKRLSGLLNDSSVEDLPRGTKFYTMNSMERAIVQRDDFTFGLSMSSSRIANYETGNNENLKAWYMGQGVTYFYTADTQQYNKDYWPTVDSKRLPGVTSDGQIRSGGTTKSANAVSNSLDGINGSAVMEISPNDIVSGTTKSELGAYKSWFTVGDAVVALGTGITSPNTVETIIDNHRIEGTKKVLANGNTVVFGDGEEKQVDGNWFHIEGNATGGDMGYVILDDSKVSVKKETNTAAWSDINQLQEFLTTDKKTNSFVSLSIKHGSDITNKSYAYAVYPGKTASETQALSKNANFEVLANNETVQAISSEGVKYYNFLKAGKMDGIEVNGSASIIVSEENGKMNFSVASLNRAGAAIEMTLDKIYDSPAVDNSSVQVLGNEPVKLSIATNKDGSSTRFTLEDKPTAVVKGDNLALGKTATASSMDPAPTLNVVPQNAIDGDTTTRWAAASDEEQATFTVDLGQEMEFNNLRILWETAHAKEFEIRVSNDGKDFSKVVYSTDTGPGGDQTIDIENTKARYVQYHQLKRWNHPSNGKSYGTSFYEFEIYNLRNRQNVIDAVALADEFFAKYTVEEIEEGYYKRVEEAYLFATKALKNSKLEQSEYDKIAKELTDAVNEAKNHLVIKLESISVNMEVVDLQIGKTAKIEVTYNPTNATYKNATFISNNENIASVDADGNIKAVAPGETIISVIAGKEDSDNKVMATVTVRVTADKTALQEAIDQAGKIDADKYTKETYQVLLKAVDAAKLLLDNPYALEDEIEKATQNILNAIKGLKEVADNPKVDDITNTTKPSTGVDTGDSTGLIGLFTSLAGAGIGLSALKKKKKENN